LNSASGGTMGCSGGRGKAPPCIPAVGKVLVYS
jgi:hypothetical protein